MRGDPHLRRAGDLAGRDVMAARFQVVSMARGFTWRFMSANNRSLAKSAHTCADVESCLATIRAVQERLPGAVGETVRDRHRQWVWRVRLDDEVVATAARSYSRQVRARMTCEAFMHLVAETAGSAPVQVMHR